MTGDKHGGEDDLQRRGVDDPPEKPEAPRIERILDPVGHQRSGSLLTEKMLVTPVTEGGLPGAIHKPLERLRFLPDTDPLEGQPELAYPQAELPGGGGRNRTLDALHVQRGGRDLGNIPWILVKSIDLGGAGMEENTALKDGKRRHLSASRPESRAIGEA